MIRFFLFVFVRFLLASIVVYFVLTIIKGFMKGLRGGDEQPVKRVRRNPFQKQPSQKKQEYGDIQDARFTELPKDRSDARSEQQD
jgi:hypothetical protein